MKVNVPVKQWKTVSLTTFEINHMAKQFLKVLPVSPSITSTLEGRSLQTDRQTDRERERERERESERASERERPL